MHVVFKYIDRETGLVALVLWALFTSKLYEAFRVAQCKKPWLVKSWLVNPRTALLESWTNDQNSACEEFGQKFW